MADPLSLVSAIVGLTAVGTKLFNQLYQFIESFRSAPSNILGLARELEELCSILTRLESTLCSGVRHEVLWLGLRDVLESCVKRFSQLEELVRIYRIHEGDGRISRQWKKWRWTFQEKEVGALRIQLEAHKATLNITLLLSTHSETTSVKDTADRIEFAVQAVLERLGEMQDDGGGIASYASGMRRYFQESVSSLDCLSTVEDSEDQQFGFEEVELLPDEGQPSVGEQKGANCARILDAVIPKLIGGGQVPSDRGRLSREEHMPVRGETLSPVEKGRSTEEEESQLLDDEEVQVLIQELCQSSKLEDQNEGAEAEITKCSQPLFEKKRLLKDDGGEGESIELVLISLVGEEVNEGTDGGAEMAVSYPVPVFVGRTENESMGAKKNILTKEHRTEILDENLELCKQSWGEDKEEDRELQLDVSSKSENNQFRMQFIKIWTGRDRFEEEEEDTLQPKGPMGIFEPRIPDHFGIWGRIKLSHDEADHQPKVRDEDTGFSRGIMPQPPRDENGSLGKESCPTQGGRLGIRPGAIKEAEIWPIIWVLSQYFDKSHTILEKGEKGQVVNKVEEEGEEERQQWGDRKAMGLQLGLPWSYRQTLTQIKEENNKPKKISIEEVNCERVQKGPAVKWKNIRDTERNKTSRKSSETKFTAYGNQRHIYTVCYNTEIDTVISNGRGSLNSLILPKTHNCREALDEQTISKYIERIKLSARALHLFTAPSAKGRKALADSRQADATQLHICYWPAASEIALKTGRGLLLICLIEDDGNYI